MFYDFFSAFNTIQRHLFSEKLLNMNVHASTVTWILNYLTNRPQYVKVQSVRKSCSNQQTLASEQTVISDVISTNQELHGGQFCYRFCFLFVRQIVQPRMMIVTLANMLMTRY